MISYKNIKCYEHLPFSAYSRTDGYSFSFLKREVGGVAPEFISSDKVKLGSLVDSILMQPNEADISSPLWEQAKDIASQLKFTFNALIPKFKCQRSYTGIAQYKGVSLNVKGRTDWEIPGQAIIDLKVTSASNDKQFTALIEHMAYTDQQWNYAKLAGVKRAYLLPYSTTAKKPLSIISLPIDADFNSFWAEKILRFGK